MFEPTELKVLPAALKLFDGDMNMLLEGVEKLCAGTFAIIQLQIKSSGEKMLKKMAYI